MSLSGPACKRRGTFCPDCGYSACILRKRDTARSPAGGKSEALTGQGWVYFNPDVGLEYAPNHPVESGEVSDATDVRASTEFEDWLVREAAAKRPFATGEKSSDLGELVERAWQDLLDVDDRTSPVEYPEMCLISREELTGFMEAALDARSTAPPDETLRKRLIDEADHLDRLDGRDQISGMEGTADLLREAARAVGASQ